MTKNELKTMKHETSNKNKNSLLLPKTLRLFIIICNLRNELIKRHRTHIFVAYDKIKDFQNSTKRTSNKCYVSNLLLNSHEYAFVTYADDGQI